ncbi:DUF4169 family protein [Novosphingobium ovatum]|nr:DUF4169 family protein [Novosphingobium ovatum]
MEQVGDRQGAAAGGKLLSALPGQLTTVSTGASVAATARGLTTMAQIINLRTARKAKARETAAKQADANRAKHGQTKAERAAQKATQDRMDRVVDGARLDGAGLDGEKPDEASHD